MHKAISIIQFKLEGVLAKEHPDFHMENRCVLEGIDPEKGTVQLPDGSMHNLLDTHFPTIDWEHPYELTGWGKRSSGAPELSISNCEKLQNHMQLLLDKGGFIRPITGTFFSMEVFR